jgi:hypothetical protein
MGDIDSTDTGSDPVYLFSEIMKEGEGVKLDCDRKRTCQNRFKRRQRGNDIEIHTNQIEKKGIHNESTCQNESAIFPVLIDSIGNEKEYDNQRKQGIDHIERQ